NILASEAAVAETLATRWPTKTRNEISSLSADCVDSTLPSRTETLLERPLTATASAASAPAFFAASTRAATRSTSLEASTLFDMGFSLRHVSDAAALRERHQAPSIVPAMLVQWVQAKGFAVRLPFAWTWPAQIGQPGHEEPCMAVVTPTINS